MQNHVCTYEYSIHEQLHGLPSGAPTSLWPLWSLLASWSFFFSVVWLVTWNFRYPALLHVSWDCSCKQEENRDRRVWLLTLTLKQEGAIILGPYLLQLEKKVSLSRVLDACEPLLPWLGLWWDCLRAGGAEPGPTQDQCMHHCASKWHVLPAVVAVCGAGLWSTHK